jgi:hypothetical protein
VIIMIKDVLHGGLLTPFRLLFKVMLTLRLKKELFALSIYTDSLLVMVVLIFTLMLFLIRRFIIVAKCSFICVM